MAKGGWTDIEEKLFRYLSTEYSASMELKLY